ncbi:right-handed parallel beta-helix repeat-containing protein [Glycomyces sp. TRM65418]|uniref:right-handed parallel beta-helix repeat-containing protein n=1 Tax=Glycomyces sp. TRM65418 TaxID=2867006 RepID=UPI001CE65FD3|nr:right-handed parallel beta-helix repeat-containing protein [Glycomyces sp. TRM65418]MCC3763517.1 right-handed parallel beta-helix repeat-containing protein [Glycomyces sp. TRM65418]QZD57501.1 right-handed parallel beta-helix repeat-containing protein [Glycomyces sp. TRM65418]
MPHPRAAAFGALLTATAICASLLAGALWTEPPPAPPARHALDDVPSGAAPPEYREDGPSLLVCPSDPEDFTERNEGVGYNKRIQNERLYEECPERGYTSLADAVADALATDGTRVLVLPGHYPGTGVQILDAPDDAAEGPGEGADLQIEGLGDSPDDVQFSAGFDHDSALVIGSRMSVYLKGFMLTEARVSGLDLGGVHSAVVEGVAGVGNRANGLAIGGAGPVAVLDCRAEGNGNAGITLSGLQTTVDSCEATGNRIGMRVGGQTDLELTGNHLHGNATGLLIAEPVADAGLRVSGNLIHDNNAEAEIDSPACEPERGGIGDAGVRCVDLTAPAGVGVAISGSGVHLADNHIWGQRLAAVAVWSPTGGPRAEGNRIEGNTLGFRDDGARSRNRIDLWWDGTGSGNCFDQPAHHTTPDVLPGCGASVDRVYGDPLRAYKVWRCGPEAVAGGEAPTGCDWLGATSTDRIEFQAAVLFATSLLFLTGAGWLAAARAPIAPRPHQMTFSAMATGAGALLLLLALWSGRADYEAIAIGLWGLGWLLAGRSWRRCGLPFFGTFTGLIGLLAVVDALDRGVWTIAPLPVSPAWLWLALLPLWTLVALGVAFRPRAREEEPAPVERTPVTAPSHDRFDW